ncbi:class I SAM-dependent methyltransferase [Azospirillum isscasi]|uniref:Class I SAM-dependent methyltransferase n=1 Tax=Azospirillum isscasi TaxID=3053926 RepID=A0ABU0WIW7_9PROT|nr:class I SAM-dependent methyltransferase [Azospirillum isscasi]MDQ2104160.1 class I SAM-dependent methyltransferase [Azospirillum isscasi]
MTDQPSGTAASPPNAPSFRIDWGLQGLLRLIDSYDFRTVLDVGSGGGDHARLLRHIGKEVVTVDLHRSADIRADFMDAAIDRTFDVVWCSHVLEHQRDPGAFLEKLRRCLAPDGVLAISVPTHPADRMVAGHVSSWNAWLLCYHLVLAGFDCAEARYVNTVDLSLIVRHRPALAGDIGTDAGSGADPFTAIAPFFPFPVSQGATAPLGEMNWGGFDYLVPGGFPPFRLHSRFLPPEGLFIGGSG